MEGAWHVNQTTLAACALVCHDWCLASRYHLFHSIGLYAKVRYDSFVKHVLRKDNLRQRLRSTRPLLVANHLPYDASNVTTTITEIDVGRPIPSLPMRVRWTPA